MRWIVGSSIRFRRLVMAAAIGLLAVGVAQLANVRADLLPEFQGPTVEVQTEALGLSAEEVEQLITVPLEQDLLVGIAFLDEIESVSLPGLSSVVMTFEPGTDVLDARQVVGERLTQAVAAAGLPQVARPPQMIQPVSSTSRVAMVKLSSVGLTPIEMSLLSRWVITPRLLGVEGVANVSTWGFRDRQLQVLVDPQRLADAGVTLNQVIRTAGNALEVSPLSFLEASSPGTGGFIDTLNQRLHVFHKEAISTAEELRKVPVEDAAGGVSHEGGALTLGDVADVVEDHPPLIGDALCGDGECLLLVIEKFPGADTPEVSRGIDIALAELAPGLPGLQMDTSMYRPANYIASSFDNLAGAALIGAILLVVVLGGLLFDWRSSVVAVGSIVTSLAAAWLVLHLTNTVVNTMILAGLVMALLVLVDDAVGDVVRIGQEVQRLGLGSDDARRSPVLFAAISNRGAALFATLMIGTAVVPAYFGRGEAGAFLPPILTTYLLAVAASMLVALTLTPALATVLVGTGRRGVRESPVAGLLGRRYDAIAPRIVPSPLVAVVVFAAAVLVGAVTAPFLTVSMRPMLQERDVVVALEAPPGTSLQRMDAITARSVSALTAVPGVRGVGAHVGRAVQSDQIVNVNAAEVWLSIDPEAGYADVRNAIDSVAAGLHDVEATAATYSEQRIDSVLARDRDRLVARVYGQDQAVLEAKAQEINEQIAGVAGIVASRVELPAYEPTIEVQPDIEAAESVGLAPGDVRRAATTLLSGLVVGNLFDSQKVFEVAVWGSEEIRRSEADVKELLIDTPSGRLVPLGQVADVRVVPNQAVIRHESVEAYVDVVADIAGRDPAAVAADMGAVIQQIEFPIEHHAAVLGGYQEDAAARQAMAAIVIASVIVVFLLLQAAFASWRLALVAFLTLPMALSGGVVAILLGGGEVTLGAVAGLVAVLGLATRGVVMLIRRCQELERRGSPFGADLVVAATSERLLPTIATALGSAALLLPFAARSGDAGFEIVGPLAWVVLGGLVTTLLLVLVVVPAAYLRFGFVASKDESLDDLLAEVRKTEPAKAG